MREIEKNDLVSFDTDLIGPYGYCSDISRAWVCSGRPTDEQRRLYSIAYEQIQHNISGFVSRHDLQGSFRKMLENT